MSWNSTVHNKKSTDSVIVTEFIRPDRPEHELKIWEAQVSP